MQATLQSWSQRCDSALADLEAQVEKVKSEAVDREKVRRKRERALEAAMQSTDEKGNGKRSLLGLGEDDAMDIDDEGGSSRVSRGLKRGSGGAFGAFGMGRRLG